METNKFSIGISYEIFFSFKIKTDIKYIISVIVIEECPEPSSYSNSVHELDNEDPYSEGSYVIYSCANGYLMSGESDNVIHVCREGDGGTMMWEGPTVNCEGKWVMIIIITRLLEQRCL